MSSDVCPHCPKGCQCAHCRDRRLSLEMKDWERRTGLTRHDLVIGRITMINNTWVEARTSKPISLNSGNKSVKP